jgi:hypothetical protein
VGRVSGLHRRDVVRTGGNAEEDADSATRRVPPGGLCRTDAAGRDHGAVGVISTAGGALPTPPSADSSDVQKAVSETPRPETVEVAINTRLEGRSLVDGAIEPLPPPREALSSLTPNKIELKVPHKDFSREGKERALRVSFDDIDLLKILNMEPVPLNAEEYLPDWLKGLNGQKVRLRGWMFPPLMTEGLPAFLFVRDNQICCFGREAKVYDKVRVTMKEGTTTDYIFGRPFDVVGTFHIESEERDGELYFLYSIDDAVVMK